MLGNDAAHGKMVANQSDANQIHLFSKTLLEYLFTLPTQIALGSEESREE